MRRWEDFEGQSVMDNVQLLVSGYLDGELTESEADQLAAELENDSAAIDWFVLNNFVHSQLLEWMNQKHVPSGAVAAAADSPTIDEFRDDEYLVSPGRLTFDAEKQTDRGATHRRRSWAFPAAGAIVAASIAVALFIVQSRSVFVGTLTEANNCRWGSAPAGLAVGSFLEDGQKLELMKGRAEITFRSGAKLLLEAPVSVQLESANELRLNNGRIAAKVPRQAIGFTVNSSLASFVDLGTAFTVDLEAEKSFKLLVFEGLVEVGLDKRFGTAANRPVRIAEVRAVTFDIDSDSRDVEAMPFPEGMQMPF
jgi:ferric-dicitrate binding protein FerR (iron transport regulator)